jgi:hypothetical protein
MITIHQDLPKKDTAIKFPHECLHKNIQHFLETNNLYQHMYYVSCNHYFLFIYLNNDIRVDVTLHNINY